MSWASADLDPGPMPLWAQIADRLRSDILAGAFSSGDLLPGEAELNRRFGVSRTTARAALDRLEQEGRITRRPGRGSIVLPPRVERPLNLLSSFAEDMRARGLRAGYRTRSVRLLPAPPEAAAALRLAPGAPALTIDRLLCADGRPIAVSLTWLAPCVTARCPAPTAAELDEGSLYRWIEERAGLRLLGGSERIEAALADAPTARSLELSPPAAVLVARRTSRARDRGGAEERPVEHVLLHYRADRYGFHVELSRP